MLEPGRGQYVRAEEGTVMQLEVVWLVEFFLYVHFAIAIAMNDELLDWLHLVMIYSLKNLFRFTVSNK